ncbi:Uma2 family endonuclease [Trichocoleus sp. FACHB-90]|uniref:Uma2 family endonuclease n=1 Tax=Cyanophyceae TaxID=3028117 RepID=UPI001686D5D7|nr:Uma2 family endonuclease [Trichocoleus sp. FACHB-90]MBD1926143.1 Uma2 family endonuclease [Trichocoleus sp. FACHB-90]
MVLSAQELEEMMPDATQLYSDEPEMESSLHYMQLLLLVSCLEWLCRDREDFFIGANLTIYFSRQQLRNRDFRGPDFFLVKQTQKRPRNAWVVWEEDGKYPNLIIELLSTSTATTDRTLKKDLYQDRFRTPEYFWFSPDTLEFEGWRLMGNRYQEIALNDMGWRWSEELGLYLGVEQGQLRYFTPEGDLVPTPEEAAQQAIQNAQQAQAQAQQAQAELEQAQAQAQQAQAELEQERLRAQLLAERLRSLGLDPD